MRKWQEVKSFLDKIKKLCLRTHPNDQQRDALMDDYEGNLETFLRLQNAAMATELALDPGKNKQPHSSRKTG